MRVLERASGFSILLQLGLALAGTLLVAPFYLTPGIVDPDSFSHEERVPDTHDMDTHLFTLEEFDKGVRAGNFYPRWQAGFDNGYGLPWLNYYQPGFFYPTEIAYRLLGDSIDAFFVISVLFMAASGLGFYWLARCFYAPLPSAAGALFYMSAPYHLLDLYHRGAMPEFAGFVFAPPIFHLAYLAATRGRARHLAGLAAAYGLLLFTHWPTALLLSVTLALYGVIWAAWERDWRIAGRVALGGILGVLLTAIHWLPAAMESRFMQELWTISVPYADSYLPSWPPEQGFLGLVNACLLVEVLAIAAAAVVLALVRARDDSRQTRLFLVLGAVSVFMITRLSSPISRMIPKIDLVQFPWRWLLLITFFAALAATAVLDRLRTAERAWAYRLALVIAVLWNAWPSDNVVMKAFLNGGLQRDPTHVDEMFFPKDAWNPKILPDLPQATLTPGRGSAQVVRWGPLQREVAVVAERPSTLTLKTYNFPGWVAQLDGHAAEIRSDARGIQTVEVPAGRHRIDVQFVNTAPRTIGALISALALGALGVLLVFDISAKG